MSDSELKLDGNAVSPEGNVDGTVDLSAVNLSDIVSSEEQVPPDLSAVSEEICQTAEASSDLLNEDKLASVVGTLELGQDESQTTQLDQSVFTESANAQKKKVDQDENFGSYLRRFFASSVILLLSLLAIALSFSFDKYLKAASQNVVPADSVEFVNKYKEQFANVKGRFGYSKDNHSKPNSDSQTFQSDVRNIINATDIDYFDKKDLLISSVETLIHNSESRANEIETLKQEIARQGFLPEEVKGILADNQAIETIQRSMNALEVIKFSTASKVFSYMSTTLSNIATMVKMKGVNEQTVGNFLTQITSRGEKDINAYVNMCYLNPFEYDSDCDVIGDLDLYYKSILKDDSIDINLLKNVMNGMNQLLENEDSATFSITFNGFNARDKDITFDIEVFTSQADERALMSQGKRNPNIFILTNIVNLLKQSTFIIGEKIDMKSINVEERSLSRGGFTTTVNYSSQDFTVPIQKDTEREIFDYIDADKLLEIINRLKAKDEEAVEEEVEESGEGTDLEQSEENSESVIDDINNDIEINQEDLNLSDEELINSKLSAEEEFTPVETTDETEDYDEIVEQEIVADSDAEQSM